MCKQYGSRKPSTHRRWQVHRRVSNSVISGDVATQRLTPACSSQLRRDSQRHRQRRDARPALTLCQLEAWSSRWTHAQHQPSLWHSGQATQELIASLQGLHLLLLINQKRLTLHRALSPLPYPVTFYVDLDTFTTRAFSTSHFSIQTEEVKHGARFAMQ